MRDREIAFSRILARGVWWILACAGMTATASLSPSVSSAQTPVQLESQKLLPSDRTGT